MKGVYFLAFTIAIAAVAAGYSGQLDAQPVPSPVPSPAPTLAPVLVAPTATMLAGVQYPIDLQNCSVELQGKSVLTVHPKQGVTAFPVSWGTRQQVLFRADLPGAYDVSLYWPDASGTVRELEISLVVAGGPSPVNPPPGPAPSPAPGPTAKVSDGHLWLMTIVPDLTAETPAQGAIRADATIQSLLDAHKNQFRAIDQNAPAAYAPWITALKARGLPAAACIVDDREPAGTLRDSLSLASATPADVAALVKKWEAD
jgi:hypothetical protein